MRKFIKSVIKRILRRSTESTGDHMPLEVENDEEKILYHKSMELKSRISRIRKMQIDEGYSPCYCDEEKYAVKPHCGNCSFVSSCTVVK